MVQATSQRHPSRDLASPPAESKQRSSRPAWPSYQELHASSEQESPGAAESSRRGVAVLGEHVSEPVAIDIRESKGAQVVSWIPVPEPRKLLTEGTFCKASCLGLLSLYAGPAIGVGLGQLTQMSTSETESTAYAMAGITPVVVVASFLKHRIVQRRHAEQRTAARAAAESKIAAGLSPKEQFHRMVQNARAHGQPLSYKQEQSLIAQLRCLRSEHPEAIGPQELADGIVRLASGTAPLNVYTALDWLESDDSGLSAREIGRSLVQIARGIPRGPGAPGAALFLTEIARLHESAPATYPPAAVRADVEALLGPEALDWLATHVPELSERLAPILDGPIRAAAAGATGREEA